MHDKNLRNPAFSQGVSVAKQATSRRVKEATPSAIARSLDACHYLNVSRSTLHRLVKHGRVRQVQIGARAVGYRYTDLDAFIASATAA